jgi:transposase
MELYVGLDVSLDMTAVCVLDGAGKVIGRGRCSSTPDAIAGVVREHAPTAVRIGLEAGQLSIWLVHGLRQLGLPAICLDARHAKAALSLQINKTDDNDALGLTHIVRTGWYREVAVKSMDSQTTRALLMARAQLVSQRQTTANLIRGLLKTFGLLVGQAGGGRFAVRVRELITDNPALVAIVEPLLTVWQTLREQVADLDRQVRVRARQDAKVRRLMTAPGVVVALTYTAVIDDPARFAKSSSVGAYLGLTPRRYQSGEVDYDGHISRCADGLLRSYLFEAANVVLSRLTKPSWLKEWGEALAKRIGPRKAKVARKLAVVLHRMWMDEQEFRWSETAAA